MDCSYISTRPAYSLKSVKENENYCPSFFQLGLISNKKREFHQAVDYFKKASRGTCVNDPEPHYQQGMALLSLQEYQRALFKFKEIINTFPDTPQAIWSKRKLRSINITQMRNKRKSHRRMTRKPSRSNTQNKSRKDEVESIKF